MHPDLGPDAPDFFAVKVRLGRLPGSAGLWPAWTTAGLRPVAGKMPALPGHRPRGLALGGGVGGSGVSLLSAPCGQEACAPRTSLPGPCLGRGSGWLGCVAPVGALRAAGPPHQADGTPTLPGDPHRSQDKPLRDAGLLSCGGVAGWAMRVLPQEQAQNRGAGVALSREHLLRRRLLVWCPANTSPRYGQRTVIHQHESPSDSSFHQD